ncbi:hypothetical protein LguiB_001331 [Lonicera macranthoides]
MEIVRTVERRVELCAVRALNLTPKIFRPPDQVKTKHADGKIRRFHSTKTEWGFDRFLRLQTLTDPSNGYILDDFCIFGAKVFVVKHSGLTDAVNPYIWKVENFSTIKDYECYYSKNFVAGGYSRY